MSLTRNVERSARCSRHEEEPKKDPFSEFSIKQKRSISAMASCIATFSPLTSFIFYPAIPTISNDLKVSITEINLGVTTYLIMSAVAPSFIAALADTVGRRPTTILALSLYLAANLGLATQRKYSAFLALRMLQSAGSSGTTSLAYGICADITVPAERGKYLGWIFIGPNAASIIGPVLGSALNARFGWPSIFWMLCGISAFVLIIVIAYMPETARSVVGNGSDEAAEFNLTPFLKTLRTCKRVRVNNLKLEWTFLSTFQNPLRCVRVLLEPDSALLILVNGLFYMVYNGFQTTLSSVLKETYHLNRLQSGLVYIPFGIGCVLASVVSGHILNQDFRRLAKRANMDPKAVTRNLQDFPIEAARYRSTWVLFLFTVPASVGYGWLLVAKTNISGPLVMQLFLGMGTTGMFNVCGTLLTDTHPMAPSTAQAAMNIVRCLAAGAMTACLQPLLNRIGDGWTFTVLAGFCFLGLPLILAAQKYGPLWRQKRSAASARDSNR